jgi:hypothetical protein
MVIVNTCGFIDSAVQESLEAIGEALKENESNRHRLRRRKGSDPRSASEGAGDHRSAQL